MKIKKLDPPLTYSFDGVIVRSNPCPKESKRCPRCGKRQWFHWRYDAAFCPHCNEWIETPSDMEYALMLLDRYPLGALEEELPPEWPAPMHPLDFPVGVMPIEDWLWTFEVKGIRIGVE